jgi:hypothetical protein
MLAYDSQPCTTDWHPWRQLAVNQNTGKLNPKPLGIKTNAKIQNN